MVETKEIMKQLVECYRQIFGEAFVQKEEQYFISRQVDSLEIMQLVVALEEMFDIEFDVDELDDSLFSNINQVSKCIKEKING